MTIRLRLTLMFVAMFACLLVARGLMGTASYTQTLEDEVRREVSTAMLGIEDYLRLAATKQALAHPARPFSWVDAGLAGDISNNGLMIQVSRDPLHPLFRSDDLAPQRLPDEALAVHETASIGPAPAWVVIVADRFEMPGQGELLLQVALPHSRIDGPVHSYLQVEAAVDLAMIVIALVAGYAMAGWALTPVGRLNDEMERLSGDRLDERLPVPAKARDEMERLSLTFNRLLERIHEAFEAQKRFVADASHELRSPLTAIQGYHAMIVKRGESHPERAKEWLAVASSETERLSRLVEELLFLAKADVTHPAARAHEVFDLADLAARTVGPLSGLHERLSFEPGPRAYVRGDASHLARVLINLIHNALRATQDGGRVRVRVERHAADARLIVEDGGIGIPPEAMVHLFDRFFRADAARDRDHGGAGLGLAICRAIANAHGGRIEVASRPGEGATFVLNLPIMEAVARDAAAM